MTGCRESYKSGGFLLAEVAQGMVGWETINTSMKREIAESVIEPNTAWLFKKSIGLNILERTYIG